MKIIKPWALVAVWVVAIFFIVSERALSDSSTENISVYDYGTRSYSTHTINRGHNGSINVQSYDYGTNSSSTYSGNQSGGTGFDYGTNSFRSYTGNPYGSQHKR